MPSFSYNTDDFLPLPSNKSSCRSPPVYMPVKPQEQNSKVVSFSNMFNPLLFDKNIFVCPSQLYMFCHVNLLFVHYLVHRVHALVPPIAVCNCKNICNRST